MSLIFLKIIFWATELCLDWECPGAADTGGCQLEGSAQRGCLLIYLESYILSTSQACNEITQTYCMEMSPFLVGWTATGTASFMYWFCSTESTFLRRAELHQRENFPDQLMKHTFLQNPGLWKDASCVAWLSSRLPTTMLSFSRPAWSFAKPTFCYLFFL